MPVAKIMVIGDSLARGNDLQFGSFRTFRGKLQSLLTEGNYLVDFVGSQNLQPAVGGTDPNHEGYLSAKIDSGTDNIQGKIATILASGVAVDIVVLLVGWEDVLAATSSIGGKYSTLVSAITAAKPSAKVFVCTLPPYYNKTEGETGATYADYATLNTTIRGLAGGNVHVIDLAALGGTGSASERQAFVDTLIAQSVQAGPDVWYVGRDGAGQPPDIFGGTRYLDFASIYAVGEASLDPNASYGTGNAPGTGSLAPVSTGLGSPFFRNNVSQTQNWHHAFLAPGHAAYNTGVEIRNSCTMILKTDGTWVELYAGGRVQGYYWWNTNFYDPSAPWTLPPGCVFRQQPDGITTFWKAEGQAGTEAWQHPPETGGVGFIPGGYHGVNRDAFANMAAILMCFQARLALDDPNGPNDIAQARYLMRIGGDYQVVNSAGQRYGKSGGWDVRYDAWGYPYTVLDVGGGNYKLLTSPNWQTFGFISIRGHRVSGLGQPWSPPGVWPASPYAQAPYGLTEAQIRANPPPLPSHWTYTNPTSGFPASDYSGTTYLLTQSGADRIAQAMYSKMVSSGVMDSYVDSGGSTPSLGEGISYAPRYADQKIQPGNTLYTYADVEPSTEQGGPTWLTSALAVAVVGTAYTGQLQATAGSTFSHVSGKPSWLTISSAGALSGTVPAGPDTLYTITINATLNSISVPAVLQLQVTNSVIITTLALPNGVVNQFYAAKIDYTGIGPVTLSVSAGSLPAGTAIEGDYIVGTPTTAATSSFTILATSPYGTDTQALSILVASSANPPVITTTSMTDAVKGTSYSFTFTATGATPITWSIPVGSLPLGLSLNPSTGAVTGTPTVFGIFPITVKAVNSFDEVTKNLILLVTETAVSTTAVISPWGKFLR